jgi:hypothetical protein
MKYTTFSHCAGNETVPKAIQKEIGISISVASIKVARGSARLIRSEFLGNIKKTGWSSEIAVASNSDMTITSLKDDVGLCLQTGNMARMYADLIKLQTMYLNDAIKSAVIVLPSAPVAKQMGSNIAQAKRLERELDIFKKAYHVPTIIFALE